MAVPHAAFQPVEPKIRGQRRHRLCQQQAGLHQKRRGCGQAIRVFCGRQRERANPCRPCAAEPVHRGFWLLPSGRAGERLQQHCWEWRAGKGNAERISCSPGGHNQNTRHFQERSALSDGSGRGEGALGLGGGAGNLAHALADGLEHGQRSWLQQPAEASQPRDESWHEQRRESGHKKVGPSLDGWQAVKS